MTQDSAQIAPFNKPANAVLPAGIATINGRIERSIRKQGKDGSYFLTLIKLPAKDEFSSPGTVEVSSDNSIGRPGEVTTVRVAVSGYPRSYQTKPTRDNPDGETVYTADNRLQVVG